jgi:hypothetical protein
LKCALRNIRNVVRFPFYHAKGRNVPTDSEQRYCCSLSYLFVYPASFHTKGTNARQYQNYKGLAELSRHFSWLQSDAHPFAMIPTRDFKIDASSSFTKNFN